MVLRWFYKMPNINEWFFLIMPSATESSHNLTVSKLSIAPFYLKPEGKKYFHPITGSGIGLAGSINACFENLRKFIKENEIEHQGQARAFILYDKVKIKAPIEKIVADLKYAEQNKITMLANYRSNWTGQIFNMIAKPTKDDKYMFLENQEIKKLAPFELMPEGYIGSLSCYYGSIPIDYKFHFYTDDKYSEDISFFRDTKVRWHYWDLDVKRDKVFEI